MWSWAPERKARRVIFEMRGKISVFFSQSKALRDCIYNKISVKQKHLKYKHTHKLKSYISTGKKDWKERHQLIKLLFL